MKAYQPMLLGLGMLALAGCDSAEQAAESFTKKVEEAAVETARESLGETLKEFDKHLAEKLACADAQSVAKNAHFLNVVQGAQFGDMRLEVFGRGEVDFGGDRDSISGRAGVRLRF